MLLDLDPWLLEPLAALREVRLREARLWSFTMPQLRKAFESAAQRLRVSQLGIHLYGLRHGGVSFDLLEGRRSLEQAKARGRWRSDASLRRYGKATRRQSEAAKVDVEVREYGQAVIEHFARVVRRGAQRPLPPRA